MMKVVGFGKVVIAGCFAAVLAFALCACSGGSSSAGQQVQLEGFKMNVPSGWEASESEGVTMYAPSSDGSSDESASAAQAFLLVFTTENDTTQNVAWDVSSTDRFKEYYLTSSNEGASYSDPVDFTVDGRAGAWADYTDSSNSIKGRKLCFYLDDDTQITVQMQYPADSTDEYSAYLDGLANSIAIG